MAFFGLGRKKDKNSVGMKKIKPTVVRTQNVAKEIFKVAKSYDVKPETLDFNILDVQSYKRLNSDDRESEWEKVDNEAFRTIDESDLLNEHFELKQTYEIEIISKNMNVIPQCQDMITSVGANATKCKVYLSIKEASKVEYFPRFEIEFTQMIKKKKIRAGILINIFDDVVDDVISKVSANVRVKGQVSYSKTETFLIAQGFEPTTTVHDELILHYEKKEELDENTRVDYASRGFIQSVKEGEVLIEYMKPKEGKAGRNCKGEFIAPQEPQINNEPNFNVSSNIKVVETPESIQYIAKENGYIAFEDNTYIIKKDVDVSEVSFKTTGSISSGVDSDVNINVKEKDAIKDAVGVGMVVEVTEIDIDGNVGSNAKVRAKRATVGGQTHKTAYIEAEELDINVHKGRAKGKNIHITRLEHGSVEGDFVEIGQAIGGTIKAQDIQISVCASHVKMIATHLIEIDRMQGSENSFIINPILDEDVEEGLIKNKNNIDKLTKEIEEIEEEIQKQTEAIKEGTPAFIQIKKRLMNYKKNGIKMPESFVKKFKQFQNMQEKLVNLKEKNKDKKYDLEELLKKKASFQKDILEARVINNDEWIGYNEIKFQLVEPPVELVYKPAEGSKDKVFGLVQLDEEEYVIRPIK